MTKQERTEEMVDMFVNQHMTYEEIGSKYNLTRERVRQILSTQGLSGADGGCSVRTALKKVEYRQNLSEAQAERILKSFGCTAEEYQKIDQNLPWKESPVAKYRAKRGHAKLNNIDWDLSLSDWWKIWQDSGKWDSKGLSKGGYVMTRKDTSLPYTKDNATIMTLSESSYNTRMRKLGS